MECSCIVSSRVLLLKCNHLQWQTNQFVLPLFEYVSCQIRVLVIHGQSLRQLAQLYGWKQYLKKMGYLAMARSRLEQYELAQLWLDWGLKNMGLASLAS